MEIFHYKSNPENFGDVLNRFIWPKIFEGCEKLKKDTLFLGVGTVISNDLLANLVDKYSEIIVFGSGAGYGELPKINKKWNFIFVRGPKTAEILGLNNLKYITDPANLIQILYKNRQQKKYKVSYIPHHSSLKFFDYEKLCEMLKFNFISPAWDVQRVMDDISSTELLIAEAMHGAIVADALRVPWVPVKCYPHILDFKWIDWTSTVDLPYEPISIDSAYRCMEGNGFNDIFKTKIKRLSNTFGFWREDWWPLPPKKSTKKQIENICNQLSRIDSNSAFLSKDMVNSLNLEKIIEEVEKFKKNIFFV